MKPSNLADPLIRAAIQWTSDEKEQPLDIDSYEWVERCDRSTLEHTLRAFILLNFSDRYDTFRDAALNGTRIHRLKLWAADESTVTIENVQLVDMQVQHGPLKVPSGIACTFRVVDVRWSETMVRMEKF